MGNPRFHLICNMERNKHRRAAMAYAERRDDEAHRLDCGLLHDECECHLGEECGRWRNGVLSGSCSKAGSEECDFECPYSR